jgi:hypothetical protein
MCVMCHLSVVLLYYYQRAEAQFQFNIYIYIYIYESRRTRGKRHVAGYEGDGEGIPNSGRESRKEETSMKT